MAKTIKNIFRISFKKDNSPKMTRVERYLANSGSLEELERRQRELTLQGF
jgi:hypothetical protein